MTGGEERPRRPARFIAGAVCPSCGEMDRTVVDEGPSGAERRRCVSCGFSDSAVPGNAPPPPTRFSKSPEERARGERPVRAETVRILSPAGAGPGADAEQDQDRDPAQEKRPDE